jgi:hypothetical protein
MNTLKKITTLFLVSISFNLLAQDSLLQTELTLYPLYHIKKDISKDTKFSNGPTILLSFPLCNKLSFSTGLNFQRYSYELNYNDSVYKNDLGYIKRIYEDGLDISIPVLINYNLYAYKNSFVLNISIGLEYDIWSHAYRTTEIYPLPSYIGDRNTTFCYNLSGFNYWDSNSLSFQVNTSLKYFPIKHWGILLKPFINYYFPFNDYSLNYGLGVGICYR